MQIPTIDRADPPSDGTFVDLEALLGDNEVQLIYEGLYRLREAKVDALQLVRAEGVRPSGRDFEPWDFGIPQIDRLLARIGAESGEAPPAPQEN